MIKNEGYRHMFYFYFDFLSLRILLHVFIHVHVSRWSLQGIQWPWVFILQVLCSVISDLVDVQTLSVRMQLRPSGSPIASPALSSSSVNRKGSTFSRAARPWMEGDGGACVRAEMTSETPLCFDTLIVHRRQNLPQFRSASRYLLVPHTNKGQRLRPT